MKITQTFAAVCLAVTIGACGQQPAAQAPAQAPSSTAATPAPAAVTPPPAAATDAPVVTSDKPVGTTAPSGQVTAAMLIGQWGDNGDCTKDIFLRDDGTFRSYTGGSGTWTLNGNMLTMSGPSGVGTVRVQSLSDQELQINNPDGSVGISQRC